MAERGRPRGFDRDAALAKAMEVFWARGYEGASMHELTAAMGIASPSLYAAFGCKEALFREALALYGATENDGIWGGVESAATAREACEGMLMAAAARLHPARQAAGLHGGAVGPARRRRERGPARGTGARPSRREAICWKPGCGGGQAEGDVPAGANVRAVATYRGHGPAGHVDPGPGRGEPNDAGRA